MCLDEESREVQDEGIDDSNNKSININSDNNNISNESAMAENDYSTLPTRRRRADNLERDKESPSSKSQNICNVQCARYTFVFQAYFYG